MNKHNSSNLSRKRNKKYNVYRKQIHHGIPEEIQIRNLGISSSFQVLKIIYVRFPFCCNKNEMGMVVIMMVIMKAIIIMVGIMIQPLYANDNRSSDDNSNSSYNDNNNSNNINNSNNDNVIILRIKNITNMIYIVNLLVCRPVACYA